MEPFETQLIFNSSYLPGDVRYFTISTIEDSIVENDEVFLLNFTVTDPHVVLEQDQIPVVILDNDRKILHAYLNCTMTGLN